MFPGLGVNSLESRTFVTVLPFPGLLVNSQDCVVPGIGGQLWAAMWKFPGSRSVVYPLGIDRQEGGHISQRVRSLPSHISAEFDVLYAKASDVVF